MAISKRFIRNAAASFAVMAGLFVGGYGVAYAATPSSGSSLTANTGAVTSSTTATTQTPGTSTHSNCPNSSKSSSKLSTPSGNTTSALTAGSLSQL